MGILFKENFCPPDQGFSYCRKISHRSKISTRIRKGLAPFKKIYCEHGAAIQYCKYITILQIHQVTTKNDEISLRRLECQQKLTPLQPPFE